MDNDYKVTFLRSAFALSRKRRGASTNSGGVGRGPGPAHGGKGQHGDQRGGSTAGGNETSEHVSQHAPPFDRYNKAVDYQAVCEDARDYQAVCEDARDKFVSSLRSGSLF